MRAAAGAAHDHGRPWVLDPVAVGALAPRTAFAGELMELHPAVVRGNASEVMSLAGAEFGGRGVDSLAESDEALGSATIVAQTCGCVVAVSGEVDFVTDGTDVVEVPGGSWMLTRITGSGCALGALVAAFVAVDDDALFATAAASAVLKAAGERAGQAARTGHLPRRAHRRAWTSSHARRETAIGVIRRMLDPTLYLVADVGACGERGVVATVAAAVAGGVTAVQLPRSPGDDARELVDTASELPRPAGRHGRLLPRERPPRRRPGGRGRRCARRPVGSSC